MKKQIFSVALFIGASVAFVSCEKEIIQPNNKVLSSETAIVSDDDSKNEYEKINGKRKVWYDHGGTNYGCKGSGGNCLDEVVVRPSLIADIVNTGNVIAEGVLENIKIEFKNKRASLEEVVGKNNVSGVLAGKLSASVRGIENDKFYMIFKNNANIPVAVYGITK